MASIGSPIKGPLININATTVSRSVISGGGGGGLVKRDESALVAKQTAIVAQQTSQIVSLRDQIQTVRVEVLNINNGLNGIGAQLAADSALEKQQILVDKENDRKLNERKVRIGKENQLEAKITSALLKPIASIQQKVGGVFSRIMSAIQILFLGWLTNQGIEALKANAAGNKTKLQQIFQAIVNGVTAAGRGFLFVNRVLSATANLSANVSVVSKQNVYADLFDTFSTLESVAKLVRKTVDADNVSTAENTVYTLTKPLTDSLTTSDIITINVYKAFADDTQLSDNNVYRFSSTQADSIEAIDTSENAAPDYTIGIGVANYFSEQYTANSFSTAISFS
jgi:hypothetical protein